MEIRKELFKQAKELKKKEKFAKVIHDRLISFDARQNPPEFDADNEEQEASQILLIKSSLNHDFSFHRSFMSLEIAPNNFKFEI